ncbi:uncharacterized protein LOC110236195 [Exaiptasia diaphana]|uniref:Uncharacterized protein n=1 Tax=Exaiptasia diaphana TaxID=2652724 RepID=A0A913X1A5_EXADI|nr:uncharacterized protein LOC110236195 [Exaiptasia diaphana]KXJ16167.1 hypothetical protein AC249_AIPGENE4574 [Exaiptasia diaphana]
MKDSFQIIKLLILGLASIVVSSPVPGAKKALPPKTAAHCCVDGAVRTGIRQLLPMSRILGRDVMDAAKNLSRKWTMPSTSGSNTNKPIVNLICTDLSKLKCFHEKIRKAKTAYSTLPKTKARDNVIRKLTEIDFQIKDLYAQLHRAQQAISPCGSAQQSVCTMTGPTHTATKRTSQQVAKHLFKVLSDLHGELRAMGVDFKKLRKTCPVASVQPAVGQSKPLPCL